MEADRIYHIEKRIEDLDQAFGELCDDIEDITHRLNKLENAVNPPVVVQNAIQTEAPEEDDSVIWYPNASQLRPVWGDTEIIVMFRNGYHSEPMYAEGFDWKFRGYNDDVIAWRLLTEKEKYSR